MLFPIFLSSLLKFKRFLIIRGKSNLKFYVKAEIYCFVLALRVSGQTEKNSEHNKMRVDDYIQEDGES